MAGISRIVRPKRSSNLTVSPAGFGLTAGRGTPTVSTGTATFDYYIGPSGSDSNAGTLASPWAITALWTKASTYAGKRLGILDGTYSGYNGTLYNGFYDAAYYIPAAAGGSASVQTVIGGVTPRGAVLTGAGGSIGGWTRARTAVWCVANYVTFQDLSVREAAVFGYLVTAHHCQIHRNEVQRVDRVTYGDGGYDNTCGIHFAVVANDGWIAHNYIHDIVASDPVGANESCIELYHGGNTIVEYNECADANTGIFLKEDCPGGIVRYNYVHGCGQPLYYGTNDAFAASWYQNVIENWNYDLYRRDNQNEAVGTAFYNNSFIYNGAGRIGFWVRATTGGPVSFYNNLLVRQGGSSSTSGDMGAEGSGSFALSDYNLYGTSTTFFSPGYTPVANFAAYRTAIGGRDTHSVNANPTFVGGGASLGPYQWKLTGASRGVNEGSSDGTTGGSAVNIGAFRSSGQTEQIGPSWRWPA